tara:strand:+ start:959 stop:1231 length:273 start_codon:yes stop_codon:yes gene_type:complete
MKKVSIYEFTAKEIMDILTEKNIEFEYRVDKCDQVYIGVRAKTCYHWLKFWDINSSKFGAETYSQNTGKTSKGFENSLKVYRKFNKMLNK